MKGRPVADLRRRVMETKNDFDVKGGFDELSDFYDSDELRFFLDSSRLMVQELDLAGAKNILDVATGTGHTALELAKVSPHGKITGIDISRSMIDKAELKGRGLSNVAFKQHDMERLDTLDGKYDLVTCSFGTYFLKDRVAFFKSVSEKLYRYGKIALLSFADESLMPYGMLFIADLEHLGLLREVPDSFSAQHSRLVYDLDMAGFADLKVVERKLQYVMKDPAQWWKIVWGTALKSFLKELSSQNLEVFKDYHLKKIKAMIDENKILKINVLITTGIRTAAWK